MNFTKNHFLVVIIILVGFNLFLIYSNVERQSEIIQLKDQNTTLETAKNSGFSPGEHVFVQDDIDRPDEGLSLIVMFSDRSCPICMTYELPNFERLYQRYPDRVKAYNIGKSNSYLDQYEVNFSFSTVENPNMIVKGEVPSVTNPVALLYDASGMIHDIYIAETGDHEKCNMFYERMHSLFGSLTGNTNPD